MASELEISSTFIPALYKPAALLPIARHRLSLLYLVETYPVTIVVGQTGSGKTTQLHSIWIKRDGVQMERP